MQLPDDYWQMDNPATPPFVELDPVTVYLDGMGSYVIHHNNGSEVELTTQELVLFLRLLETSCTRPRAYLPAWYLAQYIYPSQMEDAEHAVEQLISSLRRKLDEPRYHPVYLINYPHKGYKLCVPEGGISVSVQVVR